VLLWFGSWKNGFSHYVPEWVKRDQTRFPRARLRAGTVEILSTFSEANVTADARAFAALMRHLRTIDETHHTVIMVQVENEVGLQGDTRDRLPAADTAFAQPVPRELIDTSRRTVTRCCRNSGRFGNRRGSKSPAAGPTFWGKLPARTRPSWVGTMRATWIASRPPAKPNMRCRCS
jgi:hypothetical protein